jgi:2-polyprenyl-3-methyl-5-hydroxy-6-metoxy-1,4-benzoquinol methylase
VDITSDLPYVDKRSPWSSHSLIAAELVRFPAQSRVLDIGTASGTLARLCRGHSFKLFGVEPNPNWAQIALPLYEKIYVGSIEDAEDEFLRGYDVIVLGDILEHLAAPEAVLQKLVDLQRPDSTFIISVPNIANLWVRLSLLTGKFDYAERGILDRTHLRFFTRKTLLAVLKSAGLEIITIQVTPIPLELVSRFFISLPGRWLHAGFAQLTSILPTLLGYQFVAKARKP